MAGSMARITGAGPTNPRNYLVYVIATERLYGIVNGARFDFRAKSGGARGGQMRKGKEPYPQDNSAHGLDYRVKAISDKVGERGGSLPPGMYTVYKSADNATLGRPCRLAPIIGGGHTKKRFYGDANGIGGFYIHSGGPKGSDGCIVLETDTNWTKLRAAIDAVAPLKLWCVLGGKAPTYQELMKAIVGPVTA